MDSRTIRFRTSPPPGSLLTPQIASGDYPASWISLSSVSLFGCDCLLHISHWTVTTWRVRMDHISSCSELFEDFIAFAVVVQPLSCVQPFATPSTTACQAFPSCTVSWSLLKFISIELVMLSNHLREDQIFTLASTPFMTLHCLPLLCDLEWYSLSVPATTVTTFRSFMLPMPGPWHMPFSFTGCSFFPSPRPPLNCNP